MKQVKVTGRRGWPTYQALNDDDALMLARWLTREAYDRGDIEEYVTVIPDWSPEMVEWARRHYGMGNSM